MTFAALFGRWRDSFFRLFFQNFYPADAKRADVKKPSALK
jgi:hypothetical protein